MLLYAPRAVLYPRNFQRRQGQEPKGSIFMSEAFIFTASDFEKEREICKAFYRAALKPAQSQEQLFLMQQAADLATTRRPAVMAYVASSKVRLP